MSGDSGARLLARLRGRRLRRALDVLSAEAGRRVEGLYLVGGCVRDLFLGARLRDLDLVVEGDPLGLARGAAGELRATVHGPSPFRTCRLSGPEGLTVDLAMARKERYASPAALPTVEPAPIEEDLLRRDFTVNSMAIALTGPSRGRVMDPARGIADLRRRLLRIHHPRSLCDDPTRAFRAARYAARYGFTLAPGWTKALRSAVRAGAFRRLTPARLGREVRLILREPDPLAAFSRAARWKLLDRIDPSLTWSARTREALRAALEAGRGEAAERESLGLALIIRSTPPPARRRAALRLGLAGGALTRALGAAGAPEKITRLLASRRSAAGRLEVIARADPLALAAFLAAGPPGLREEAGRLLHRWSRATPALRGEDLLALGLPRGPAVGRALHALRIARAAGALRTRRDEVRFIRSRLPGAMGKG